MTTATASPSPQVARAIKAESTWSTTPSPALKALMKEQEKERQSAINRLLEEKKAGYAQAEREIAERKEVVQEPVQQAAVAVPVAPDKPKRRYLPSGPLTWVTCTLPAWEGLRLGYDLGAYWTNVNGPVKDDDNLGGIRRLMSLVKGVEGWDFYNELTDEPYPKPTPGDIESYRVLGLRDPALREWLWDTSPEGGFGRALDERLGKAWRQSPPPS